jgi:acyl-coenzyme A thioesterase PaaI-like protein
MKPDLVTDGEFKGWVTWAGEAFEHDAAGPFYFRTDAKGVVAAFRAKAKHMNQGGVVHGGCLMTFADFSLFAIAAEELGEDGYGLTVAFTSEFLSGAKEGQLLEARGDVLRAGGSLIFVRGMVTADGAPCLNFSATLKRLKPR